MTPLRTLHHFAAQESVLTDSDVDVSQNLVYPYFVGSAGDFAVSTAEVVTVATLGTDGTEVVFDVAGVDIGADLLGI